MSTLFTAYGFKKADISKTGILDIKRPVGMNNLLLLQPVRPTVYTLKGVHFRAKQQGYELVIVFENETAYNWTNVNI